MSQDDSQLAPGGAGNTTEVIDDDEKGMHLKIYRGYCAESTTSTDWFRMIKENARWYRVKYKSRRFGKECETPCWTTFYGGLPRYEPYEPVPGWLRPLVDRVSSHLGRGVRFNALLLRLYFDGNDEIAWHTDGRTFLGPRPTIASLSLGAAASFQMRRMTNAWPSTDGSSRGDDGVDRETPRRDFVLRDGDLLVMGGDTQKHWHHRVPSQGGRGPRVNVNCRYIVEGPDAERGQQTYYKYMVHGDEENPRSFSFSEIMAKRGGIRNFARPMTKVASSTSSSSHATASNVKHPIPIPRFGEAKSASVEPCPEKARPANTNGIALMSRTVESTSKSTSAVSDDKVRAYLSSERGIDASTFLALPEDIRKEIIGEWHVGREEMTKAKRATGRGSAGSRKKKGRLQRGGGLATLDKFFCQNSP